MNAVGEELLDSLVGDQIPIYTEQEKYNLTVESTVDRLTAQLEGKEVPGRCCCVEGGLRLCVYVCVWGGGGGRLH